VVDISSPLIFPIGHYVGGHYPRPDAELDCHVVRIGWETYRIEGDEQFAVWALAHGLPDSADPDPWTRPTLLGAARAAGVPRTDAVLHDLLDKDLVIEVTPGTEEAVEFAQVCRIRALQIGLGNTADDITRFAIGLADDHPLVSVPAFTYELWKWGHVCDSLWHACQVFAAATGGGALPGAAPSDDAPTVEADPERVLAQCLAATQALIAHGAAYLDEAREEYR